MKSTHFKNLDLSDEEVGNNEEKLKHGAREEGGKSTDELVGRSRGRRIRGERRIVRKRGIPSLALVR